MKNKALVFSLETQSSRLVSEVKQNRTFNITKQIMQLDIDAFLVSSL